MNNINPFALNGVKLLKLQLMEQLNAHADTDINIVEKQLSLKRTMAEALSIAKASPRGEVSIVLLKPHSQNSKITGDELLLKANYKVSFFNDNDLSGHLTSTIIFINANYNNKFRVFSKSYKLDNSYLKEI